MDQAVVRSRVSTKPGSDTTSTSPVGMPHIYAAAAENSPATLAVSFSGAGLKVVWANRAGSVLVGVGVGDRLDPDLAEAELWAPDGPPAWITRLADLVQAGVPAHDDPSDNQWEPVSIGGPNPLEGAGQMTVRSLDRGRYLVQLRSATPAEIVAERARGESEHRFTALAEHAPIGIIVSEAGTRLGYVNRCFAEITGWRPEELLGTRWLKCVYPEDLTGLLELLDRALAGERVDTSIRLLSLSDSPRWVQVRLSPVTTPRQAAGFIGTIEDVTVRRAWEAQLSYQASHDALTGLVNRRTLMEELAGLLDGRRQRDRDAAVLFCDLDRFKQVNDEQGHDAGDRVLVEVAHRMTRTARDHDVVARIAGDEFVVLATRVRGWADAQSAAERQITALQRPFRINGKRLELSISIGIAMLSSFSSANELLQAADRGMYEAKRSGLGQWRNATPEGIKSA